MSVLPTPHPLAFSFYGLTEVQVALLLSGVAMIFAIRRWRMIAVQKQRGRAGSTGPRKGSTGSGAMERAPMSNGLNVREVTAQIQSLLADVEETARRVAAQIDNRRVRLEQLLAEADEKIRRLEELTKAPTEPQRPAPPPLPNVNVMRDATQTLSRLRQERGAPPPNEDPAYAPIYQLADQGKSAREIGQALGRQPGEIELILALRGRQRV